MDAGMSRKSSLRLRAVTRISASSSPDWFCSLLVAAGTAAWTLSSVANAVKLIAPRTVTMVARMASTPSVCAVRDLAGENLVLQPIEYPLLFVDSVEPAIGPWPTMPQLPCGHTHTIGAQRYCQSVLEITVMSDLLVRKGIAGKSWRKRLPAAALQKSDDS